MLNRSWKSVAGDNGTYLCSRGRRVRQLVSVIALLILCGVALLVFGPVICREYWYYRANRSAASLAWPAGSGSISGIGIKDRGQIRLLTPLIYDDGTLAYEGVWTARDGRVVSMGVDLALRVLEPGEPVTTLLVHPQLTWHVRQLVLTEDLVLLCEREAGLVHRGGTLGRVVSVALADGRCVELPRLAGPCWPLSRGFAALGVDGSVRAYDSMAKPQTILWEGTQRWTPLAVSLDGRTIVARSADRELHVFRDYDHITSLRPRFGFRIDAVMAGAQPHEIWYYVRSTLPVESIPFLVWRFDYSTGASEPLAAARVGVDVPVVEYNEVLGTELRRVWPGAALEPAQ